jgi:hypothetical protein
MHDEVSETEHIRTNLAIERSISEGCDVLLDVNQVLCRQGKIKINKKKSILFNRIIRWSYVMDW